MKVRDLIVKLYLADPNAEVVTRTGRPYDGYDFKVECVEVNDEGLFVMYNPNIHVKDEEHVMFEGDPNEDADFADFCEALDRDLRIAREAEDRHARRLELRECIAEAVNPNKEVA